MLTNMLTPHLTYEHRRILHFIRAYREARGIGPTYRDIRDAIGFRTTGPVQNRIRDLRRWGYVARRPGEARGILLLRMPARRPIARVLRRNARRKVRIPVILEALRARRRRLFKTLHRLIEPFHAAIDGLVDRAQIWLGRRLGRLPYDPARS